MSFPIWIGSSKNLNKDTVTILDLSVGSALIDPVRDIDVKSISRRIDNKLEQEKVEIGIGRYDEARLIYTTEHYQNNESNLKEGRTIHLGYDV